MFRPGIPAPHLAPLMGRDALSERGGVTYRELETRSLLNRCDSLRMPFRWTVNPYRGCAMGCRYCYAAYTHEFMGIKGGDEFHSTVYAKAGGETETARRLSVVRGRGELVALGTATDPYQPARPSSRSPAASWSSRPSSGACDSRSPPRARSCSETSISCSASMSAPRSPSTSP